MFCLRAIYDGKREQIDISEDEFIKIMKAKQGLCEALQIEEKLNLVFDNYVELEKELINRTFNYLIFRDYDWSSFNENIYTINRRLINLFSVCRMYLDQVPRNLNKIYGKDSNVAEVFKSKTSEEYDQNLSYRVIEALRNYVQHCGIPIQHLSFNSNRIDNILDVKGKHSITPSIVISVLKEDKKFKKSILDELE